MSRFQMWCEMLTINERIQIDEDEFTWSFVRSGGPGGQNVNKVASKAVLRWNVTASAALPDDVKARFLSQQHGRITTEGELIVTSQRFRDQEKNRHDCLDKLREMIVQALTVPRPRRATKPTKGSRTRRLAEKRHRSANRDARRIPKD
jgi:ribosome-associated protein